MSAGIVEGHVEEIIRFIGDDPTREGVTETPRRVVKAWGELFAGYNEDPRKHLAKRFPIKGSQMVSLNAIPFFSTCEHHMLPFHGVADVAYIPQGRVCGLSKIARVVDGYARRLQMQERLTTQIADALEQELHPLGVAVRLRAVHMCMVSRGAKVGGNVQMVTTVLRGKLLDVPAVKNEWLASLPS